MAASSYLWRCEALECDARHKNIPSPDDDWKQALRAERLVLSPELALWGSGAPALKAPLPHRSILLVHES